MRSSSRVALFFIFFGLISPPFALAAPNSLDTRSRCNLASTASHVAPEQETLSSDLARAYSEKIDEIVGGALSDWSCNTGGCVPRSEKLVEALHSFRSSIKKVFTTGSGKVLVKLRSTELGMFHMFLVDGEIIIDPTLRQFFKPWDQVPAIFVGTVDDLRRVFRDNRTNLTYLYEYAGPDIDPDSYVNLIYSLGINSKLRKQSKSP